MTALTWRTPFWTIFALALATTTARAADDCRRSGSEIVCKAEGFDLLVRELVEARGRADTCALKLEEQSATARDLEGQLASCRALCAVSPTPIPATPRAPAWRPIVAFALGVGGAAAAALSFSSSIPTEARIGLGIGGAAALAGGVVFVLP